MQVVFIAEQPKVIIEPDGVRLIGRSGDETYERRFTRAFWRRFLETSVRQINEYEVAERGKRKVVEMAHGRHG